MRASGIDISEWQGDFHPPDNIDFIVVKATEGTATDGEWAENVVRVEPVPIKAAYHYYRTAVSPVDQAEYFWEVVRDEDIDFLAIDYEKYNNVLDEAAAVALAIFWNHLVSLTDKTIVLYTTEYVLRDNLIAFNERWRDVQLWVARWADVEDPLFLELGVEWVIWQYGIVDNIDRNVYNGTVEEMKDWLSISNGGETMNKKWYASKTLWFSIVWIIVQLVGLFGYKNFVPKMELTQWIDLALPVIVALLRVFTDKGLEL